MGRELLSFLGRGGGQSNGTSGPLALLSFPQQYVPFNVRNGIVRHDGLKVDLGEIQITTSGTVNLETEEYDLMATIGLPENLFQGREGLLASRRGQPVQIPIRGSFNRPPNLSGELVRFFQQNAGNAVRNIIGNQIERRLQGDGGLLQRGEGLLRGQGDGGAGGLLPRELGQGLNRLFGPSTPQPQQPTGPPR